MDIAASAATLASMGPGSLIAFVLIAALGVSGQVLQIRYAADRDRVESPTGKVYDVLVHPDGVMPMTTTGAWVNAYTAFPALLGAFRRARGRTGWVVRVRPSPYAGYADLFHEVTSDREAARAKADALVREIQQGHEPWPAEAEWFR